MINSPENTSPSNREASRKVIQEPLSAIEQLFITMYRAIENAGGELAEAKVLEALGLPYVNQNMKAAEDLGVKNKIFKVGTSWQSTYQLIPGHERDLARLTYYHPTMVKILTKPQSSYSAR